MKSLNFLYILHKDKNYEKLKFSRKTNYKFLLSEYLL